MLKRADKYNNLRELTMRVSLFFSLYMSIFFMSLSACSTPAKQVHIKQPQAVLASQENQPVAGSVEVDLTPPPGMSMGGYSVMANNGIGFRTRIKARILYLNDAKGNSIALVQTDLFSGSLLVHHYVAQQVAAKTGLNPEDITITGTHSHSAPANMFHNDFYNKHASSEYWLEQNYVKFTSKQIANGIIHAYETRRPAKIATGSKDIYGYNRNRALEAFAQNKNHQVDLNDAKAVFKHVNPSLYMLRVDVADDDGIYKPLAAFSGFSIHATSISAPVKVYNADLYAYVQKDLQWQIAKEFATPWQVVHAFTTSTQGDMAPAVPMQGDNYISHLPVNWKESRKLGQGIAKEAISLFRSLGSQLTSDIKVASMGRELDIRQHNKIGDISICKDPAVGNPVAAGAYERRTPFLTLIPFLHGGNVMAHRWFFFKDGCQGNKRHLGFSFLQPLLEPKDSFPKMVMFQIIRINDMLIAPLPFEVTIESGYRITNGIKEAFNSKQQNIKLAWITGNSNGYFGYTTTPEEYRYQNYEGGHTLYGQYSTPYLAAQLKALATDYLQTGEVHELSQNWDYLLNTTELLPKLKNSTGVAKITQNPTFKAAESDIKEDYVLLQWQDVAPAKINFHQSLISVEEQQSDGSWKALKIGNIPVNDEGYDIDIRYIDDADNGMAIYQTRWYNPKSGGQFRFKILARQQGKTLYSKPFSYAQHQIITN